MGQQKGQHIHDIENLQRKAIRIMNFESKYAPSKPLIIGGKVKHELRVQIHELRVPIHKLRVPIHELRVQVYELRVQMHELKD